MTTISNIHQVSDGVYTGELITSRGETVYLGMERVDSDDKDKWSRYKSVCDYLSDSSSGVLTGLALIADDLEKLARFRSMRVCNLSEEDFDEVMSQLRERNILKGQPRLQALKAVPGGTAGFLAPTYVVYASKVPIKGRIKLPTKSFSKEDIDFQEFVKDYSNILMSVGSTIKDQEDLITYSNRGIFRNPLSILEGGYGGLSMPLHSFSALVTVRFINPTLETSKEYLGIGDPINKMPEIFQNTLGSENVYQGKEIPLECRNFFSSINDSSVVVKIDELASLYL